MAINDEFLQERYSSMEFDELVELQSKGTLTEQASRILNQVLSERGMTDELKENIKNEIARESIPKIPLTNLATIQARGGAKLIDSIFCFYLLYLTSIFSKNSTLSDTISITCIISMVIYSFFADALPKGQSLGKKVFNLSVIDRRTGRSCGVLKSFMRNIFLYLGVIDWGFALGKKKQRLGDIIADTCVIKLPPSQSV